MTLHWIWQAPVETSAHGGVVTAKLRDHALLTFLHDEKPGAEPEQQGHARHQADSDACSPWVRTEPATGRTIATPATATAIVATEQTSQLAIEISPQLIKVRRALVRAGAGVSTTV
jgi:hypothetical protein